MKRSRRELSIDMVIHSGIFKNDQITLSPCFIFTSMFHLYSVYLVFTVKTERFFVKWFRIVNPHNIRKN